MATLVDGSNLRMLWDDLAEKRAEHTFLIFRHEDGREDRYTYRSFDAYINRTANYFLSLGVQPGEHVGIQVYNDPVTMACAFALAKIDAVSVPLNIQHTLEESAYALGWCQATKVVVDPDFQEYYDGRPGCYPVDQLLVTHAEGAELSDGAVDFDAAVAEQPDELTAAPPIHPMDTVQIMFTSGTTSQPKGVELTHANFLFSGYYTNWQYAMRPDDVMLTTMPAFHSNFQLAALTPVLTVGATLVYLPKYHATKFWSQVKEYHATLIQMVAMMARTMMMQPERPDDGQSDVRAIQYYLPISEEEKDAFEARFGAPLHNCYGLTESVCWSLTYLPEGEGRWPSVGRAGLGYEAAIVDADGNEVAPGELGEIVLRGTPGVSLMKGYYRDEQHTREAIDEQGWLHTGDKGYQDAEGWFYFVDRKSNMIKRAGENISASEVEDVLYEHPCVAEAAVIGVDDPVRDQAVKAFIVPEKGEEVSVEDIVDFCKGHLAYYKVPTIVEVVDKLPHTSVGKIAKKMLK